MGALWINPAHQELLARRGLATAEDFLRLEAAIVSGHPDRHVQRITLDAGRHGYLKKEHRIRWKDRLNNAWDGFGLVAKSSREAVILGQLADAGIGCPVVLAHGEAAGKAFLLVREEPGTTDLRTHLSTTSGRARRRLAEALGKALAQVHAAGFDQPDLYAKHVLVDGAGEPPRFCFLDWQRSRQRRSVSQSQRCRDLAALDATLDATLAGARDRLACLRSYLRSMFTNSCDSDRAAHMRKSWKEFASSIRARSLVLQRKPRIRDMRRASSTAGQRLVWLDGEALCVTESFREELGGAIPDWLRFSQSATSALEQRPVPLDQNRQGNLARRFVSGVGCWLRSWWNKTPAPEVEQAALLFRLERHGIPSPRLLAFGQQKPKPWQRFSFLLTEAPRVDGSLGDVLARALPMRTRRRVLRAAGILLRRLHEAGLRVDVCDFAATCAIDLESCRAALVSFEGVTRTKQDRHTLMQRDLPALLARHAQSLSRSELWRFFLSYVGRERSDRAARTLGKELAGERQAAS